MDLKLEDLMGIYPSGNTPDFQTIITAKKEFAELSSKPEEFLNPKRGRPFAHQLLFQRYLRQYNEMLYIADTGTGKSCSLAALAQYYRHHKEHIRHVYFITGSAQIEDFKKQLVCVCTNGEFEKDPESNINVDIASSEKTQKGNVTRSIGSWYTVLTYGKLVNMIKNLSNEAVREKFSGCIYFLDEIQKMKMRDYKTLSNRESSSSSSSSTSDAKSDKKRTPREIKYAQIWRLLHLVDRSIKILASARIIVNKVDELGFHLNLILPLNLQIEYRVMHLISESTGIPIIRYHQLDIATATIEDMMPFIRERILYVRAIKTHAIPVYPPKPENTVMITRGNETYESQLRLKYLSMFHARKSDGSIISGNQLRHYMTAREMSGHSDTEMDFDSVVTGKVEKNIFIDERICANWCYPMAGKSTNEINNKAWIDMNRKDKQSKFIILDRGVAKATPLLQDALRKPNGLLNMSIKAHKVVLTADEWSRPTSSRAPGKIYIFTSFAKDGGAYPLGIALEHGTVIYNPDKTEKRIGGGYERFNNTRSVFESSSNIRPYCGGNKTEGRTIKIEKKERYAIITAENASSHSAIFELYNSEENIEGDYIRVIIITPIGQVGINLTDVQYVINFESDYSPSNEYQGLSRAFRTTSHNNLINKLTSNLYLSSATGTDTNIVIRVPVDNYAAAIPFGSTAIDERIARYSEYKDRIIRSRTRLLKQAAVDCHIQKSRNVHPDDIDYSPECDYDICNYPCISPMPNYIDTSTYDVYYLDEVISDIIDNILMKYFREFSSVTIDELVLKYAHIEKRKYFYFAFERMIDRSIPVYDKFGYKSYVREDGDIFYLSRTYPRNEGPSHYESSYYNENLIAVQERSLSDINMTTVDDQLDKIWIDIRQIELNSREFFGFLNNLNMEAQTRILEESINYMVKSEAIGRINDPYIMAVLNRYSHSWMKIYKPIAEINKWKNNPPKTKTKLKRFSRPAYCPGPDDIDVITFNSHNPVVYIHRLYNPYHQNTNYSMTEKYRNVEAKIKVYENGEWHKADEAEDEVYRGLFCADYKARYAKYAKMPIHGILSYANGEVRMLIVDLKKRKSEDENDKKKENGQTEISGLFYNSYKEYDLINIMYELGINFKYVRPENTPEGRKEGIKRRETALKQIKFLKKKNNVSITGVTIRDTFIPLEKMPLSQLEYFAKQFSFKSVRSSRQSLKIPLWVEIFKHLAKNDMIFTKEGQTPEQILDVYMDELKKRNIAFEYENLDFLFED